MKPWADQQKLKNQRQCRNILKRKTKVYQPLYYAQEHIMYNFLTGPAAWFSFSVFFIGIFIRSFLYLKGLNTSLDRVTYRVNTFSGIKEAVRSSISWLIPFRTRGWRTQPLMTVLFFIFHISMIVSTIFLKAHNMILQERWGISIITIPDMLADCLTLAVIFSGAALMLRRLLKPEVKILTTLYDYLLILISILPFVTGFLAYHQYGSYAVMMLIHIISGELLLVVFPFTKLSHGFLFFFSRFQLGMDFGIKRGGMKRKKAMAW